MRRSPLTDGLAIQIWWVAGYLTADYAGAPNAVVSLRLLGWVHPPLGPDLYRAAQKIALELLQHVLMPLKHFAPKFGKSGTESLNPQNARLDRTSAGSGSSRDRTILLWNRVCDYWGAMPDRA
jgi:hypothetical protein